MTKTCAYCGKTFEVDDFNHNEKRRKYCSDFCRSSALNEMARERIRVGKRSYNVECEVCGKVFLTNRSENKTCSPECRHERDLRVKRENHRKFREAMKEDNAIKRVTQKQKKVESLTEVHRKAREAGMSYGKYMEMQFLQQLQEERERNGGA